MTSLVKLSALGAAGTAAAAALTWVAMGQPAKQPPQRGESLVICAGADSILRAASGGSCPAGQTSVPLKPGDASDSMLSKLLGPDGGGPSKQPPQPPPADDRLGDLERRVDRLRLAPLFTVVDGANRPIFSVRPNGVVTYNAEGAPAAALLMFDGGVFRALSSDGTLVAETAASTESAGFQTSDGAATRLNAGRQPSGAYALKALSSGSTDNPIAGIGESRAGTGAIVVGDVDSHPRSSITLVDGRGAVNVLSAEGYPIVSLTQGENGAGMFRIADSGGQVMVKMDVNQNRYGAVLTGPRAGMPYVPSSGLPGSFFFGCAGGAACRD